jgi:tetrapyrrole methylase family protein/MazG family protein/ATP diphosphatase
MSEPKPLAAQDGRTLPELVEVMQRLLAPDGCPWDREQTLASLRPFVIEEAHEVVDAIDRGSPEMLREELGDLLLQIVFQSELARAAG